MLRFLRSLFRRRPVPVIINHYHTRRITDLQQRRDLKHVELARELGRTWKDR